MKKILPLLLHGFLLFFVSCSSTKQVATGTDDGKIEVVFVQVNDVYEIAPLAGGREGGMARVATLKKEYLLKNPNTFLVMAGDFVSPSVYNSLPYQGKRIRGRQMIESMNAAGMDLAVFGNHEFDINESELQDRINESEFMWVSSNSFHKLKDRIEPFKRTSSAKPFSFPETYIMQVKDKDGTTAKIGFIGLTLPFNRAEYVSYTDALVSAKSLYDRIKDSVDAVVAITHQGVAEDKILAREIPGLAFIMGGHEHNMRFEKVGNVYITKAHANAKSAYVVSLTINKKSSKLQVVPQLKMIDENVALDSAANVVVQKWVKIAEDTYRDIGFDAKNVLLSSSDSLEGRDIYLRSQPTNLTKLIVASMAEAAPKADVVIMNSGSIRIDDVLQMPLSQYDILRALPFGGGIKEVDMKGSLLIRTLNAGNKNKGIGGYLLFNENISLNNTTWKINGQAIDPLKNYRVAITDFLLTGKEANMDFLNEKNPEIIKVYPSESAKENPLSDIRLAIVRYLQKRQ